MKGDVQGMEVVENAGLAAESVPRHFSTPRPEKYHLALLA